MNRTRSGIVGVVLHSAYPSQHCSVARSLEVIGERWSLLIVRELLYRPQRFIDLERTLGVAKNVLTNRLDKLAQHGVVDKAGGSGYCLTDKGRDLFPVLAALTHWGDTYETGDGPPVLFEHSCGHASDHVIVCGHCREPVTLATVTPKPGPGAHRPD